MATGYARQSSGLITNGVTIQASHHNNEFDAILAFANATTGHNHDGTAGGGAVIPTAGMSGLTSTSAGIIAATGTNTVAVRTITGTADKITVTNGTGASANPTITIASTYAGQNTITTLGTITTGVWTGTDIAVADGGTGASSASDARTNLGLIIGTDVQAYDANLTAFADLSLIADRLPYANGTGTLSLTTFTGAARNLLDDATASDMRTTLGLGAMALQSTTSASATFANTGFGIANSDGSHFVTIRPGTEYTDDRVFTITTGDTNRTLTLNGNATLDDWFDQSTKTSANPTFNTPTISGLRLVDTGIISTSGSTGSYSLAGWNGSAFVNMLTVTSATAPTIEIRGTTTNDDATAGFVGEVIDDEIASGSATSLTTGTAKTIISISLTAGDWDVWGSIGFLPNTASGTRVSQMLSCISLSDNTISTAPFGGGFAAISTALAAPPTGSVLPTGQTRISVASTTTVYLVARCNFDTSTLTAYGYIGARRVR